MHIYMFWCFCKLVFRPYLSLPAAVTKTTIIIVLSLLPIQPVEPTTAPTEDPTVEPTTEPTEDPTVEPTTEPTEEPTVEPTSSDPEYEEIELTGLNGLNMSSMKTPCLLTSDTLQYMILLIQCGIYSA